MEWCVTQKIAFKAVSLVVNTYSAELTMRKIELIGGIVRDSNVPYSRLIIADTNNLMAVLLSR